MRGWIRSLNRKAHAPIFWQYVGGNSGQGQEEFAVRIGRIVDLSRRLDEDTQVYPGDPHPRFEPAATIASEGVNVLRVCLGSHSGTHVDAPYHFFEEGERIDGLDPSVFIGPAALIDVRKKRPREKITVEDLHIYRERLRPGTISVLQTGWDVYHNTLRYYDHPFLDRLAARYLLERGVRTVVTDAISVDETVLKGPHPEDYPAHRCILGAGGIVAENLMNIGAIDFPDPLISLLPVKLCGADGAPARVVALEILP